MGEPAPKTGEFSLTAAAHNALALFVFDAGVKRRATRDKRRQEQKQKQRPTAGEALAGQATRQTRGSDGAVQMTPTATRG